MDNYIQLYNDLVGRLLNSVTFAFSLLTILPDVDLYLRILGLLIAAVAGFFTVRYHRAAHEKTKREIELLDKQLKAKENGN